MAQNPGSGRRPTRADIPGGQRITNIEGRAPGMGLIGPALVPLQL